MPMPFDPRWLLPGGTLYNVAADGPGTFSVPVQPDGAPQQEPTPPKPPPENVPENNFGPTNPVGKPPIMTGVGGLGMQTRIDPPTSPLTPVAPPTQTLPAPTGRKNDVVPAYGPGVSQPSVTQAPVMPVEPAFNPDTREAVRKATPPAGTPATQSGNMWDDMIKKMKDPKFGPMIAALAKMGGSGQLAPKAPAWHSTLQGGNPGYHPGNPGSAAQMMQGLTGGAQKREEDRLKKQGQKRRQQDRYDILKGEM